MFKDDIVKRANKFGDFYIYFKVPASQAGRNKRRTNYLAATIDFDNKYIQGRAKQRGIDLSKPITDDSVLVFSWTTNNFRWLKTSDVVRMVPLANELRRARR